jgi:hypothetical protein
MAGNPSVKKRQKEMERRERQKQKDVKRAERRAGAKPERIPGGEDPDLVGIVPGPQPVVDDAQ